MWGEGRPAEGRRGAPRLRPLAVCSGLAGSEWNERRPAEGSRGAPRLRPPAECTGLAGSEWNERRPAERSRGAPRLRLPAECTGLAGPATMTPAPGRLLAMYAGMLRVRLFEERVRELFAGGRIPGFLHTSVGQEAVAVGVCAALRPDDYVLSTHRGHGHLVAKGGSLRGLMAELYGKANGICHGKGGTMHIADASVGYLGANGVLAAGCVLAPGVGLSIKHRRSGRVVVAFFGDGAANRGPFHAGVNLAALWKLPVIF